MDNKDNTQVFNLEEIMREFATESPEPAPEEPEEAVTAAEPAASAEAPEASEEALDAAEAAPEMTDDTIRLDDLSEAFDRARQMIEHTVTTAEENVAAAGSDLPEESDEDADMTVVEEKTSERQIPAEQIPAPQPIVFRSRLRDLKRKLVAGPEKRYYDLTEVGLGRVQAAIFASFMVVCLSAGASGLYALGLVMENRLRLMVFSQILAMMVSALLGCYVLMDGIVDLFTGKFSLNTMLVLTLAACAADAVFCLQELRVPCCAAFCLEMTMALWNRSLRRQTEMGQMDTLRKATRLDSLVKSPNYYDGQSGILRGEGRVEDFMDHYEAPTGPEKVQNIYAMISLLLCIGIAVLGYLRHGLSFAVQVLATSLLVAVPAGAFIAQSRPAAILQRRLHMVGTVICGWQGVKQLCGKAVFPLTDRDLFPVGATKLNGVKFFGEREPEEVIAYATALIKANGGGLEPVFTQLLRSRSCPSYPVTNLQIHSAGGLTGVVRNESVTLGSLEFLTAQGIWVPEGTMVPQAVYCAIEGEFSAVFAINYNRTRSAAGGLVTLGGQRKIRKVVLSTDFMITGPMLKSKFGVRTKRFDFPERQIRDELAKVKPDPELLAAALTTQENLSSAAYAVTGARTLRTTSRCGLAIHMFAGILGMLIMAALAYIGSTELLTPVTVLLYQLVWLLPGLLITEWTRTV